MDSKQFLRKLQDGTLKKADLMEAHRYMCELELEVLRHKTANFESLHRAPKDELKGDE